MIFVENEFAPLKKVILTVSEFGFPEMMKVEDLRFLSSTALEGGICQCRKRFWRSVSRIAKGMGTRAA